VRGRNVRTFVRPQACARKACKFHIENQSVSASLVGSLLILIVLFSFEDKSFRALVSLTLVSIKQQLIAID
jgi:hypothetical protein